MLYIAISGIKAFGVEETNLFVEPNKMFVVNAIIYSSYNFIMLFPLITSLNEKDISKKEVKIICIAVFVIIVVSSIFILMLLNIFDISNVEIPIIYIANFIGNNFVILGVIMVLLAIFTSIICVGYSFFK